jgi:3-oxoacyl-[acyl-carrier-protein] synthase III
MDTSGPENISISSFFERPNVQREILPFGKGVPFGMEKIYNPRLEIGGAYGTWGESYSNETISGLIEERWGRVLSEQERLNLGELGFLYRHHVPLLSNEEYFNLEVEVGTRFLRAALQACEWDPKEVDAVLIGMSGPASDDYTSLICRLVGIPERAYKLSVHKACDSSVAALNMVLNPELAIHDRMGVNLAEQLKGKKVLVGGIEGLSRFILMSHDTNAAQLFGNGAGVIGVIPGQTMKFIAGASREAYDEEGMLQVRMLYPHSRIRKPDQSMTEISKTDEGQYIIAGLMHEPEQGDPVVMAGPMGMVKLFVRTGVQVVQEAYDAYQRKISELGIPGKEFAVAIVHHANLKINQLKEKHLQREGISIPMPWLIKEFGNVSAASNMIALLRELPLLKPGDHILIDGFGAGTYYDVLAVELTD